MYTVFETNISKKHILLKNPSWLEAGQGAIHGGVEFGTTEVETANGMEENFKLGPLDYKSNILTTWPCLCIVLFQFLYGKFVCSFYLYYHSSNDV